MGIKQAGRFSSEQQENLKWLLAELEQRDKDSTLNN